MTPALIPYSVDRHVKNSNTQSPFAFAMCKDMCVFAYARTLYNQRQGSSQLPGLSGAALERKWNLFWASAWLAWMARVFWVKEATGATVEPDNVLSVLRCERSGAGAEVAGPRQSGGLQLSWEGSVHMPRRSL